MKRGQALAQMALLESGFGHFDGSNRYVFDDDMWGHGDASVHRMSAGIEQGDAATIGMPQQHWFLNAGLGQKFGQYLPGFLLQIVGPERVAAAHIGHAVGVAIASA